MADAKYNRFKKELADGNIDLVNDTIKLALVTSAYTPDIDTHDFFDDITNEVVGTGYVAGGAALTTKATTQDNTNDQMDYTADNVTWSSSTITARAAVLYKDTGAAATSPLIAYFDFGSDQSSSSGDFTVQWDAGGILTIT